MVDRIFIISMMFFSLGANANADFLVIDRNNSSLNFSGSPIDYDDFASRDINRFISNDYIPNEVQDFEKIPLSLLSGIESGSYLIGASKAHAKGLSGQGEIIAIWDTGLGDGSKNSIADLKGRVLDIFLSENQEKYLKMIDNKFTSKGFTMVNPPPMPGADLVGHGTHVAGIIAMDGNASVEGGSKRIMGVAPASQLVIQPLTSPKPALSDRDIFGFFDLYLPKKTSQLYAMLDRGKKRGARTFSNSWGQDDRGKYAEIDYTFDQWAYKNSDCTLVFAAGNAGERDSRQNDLLNSTPGNARLLSPSVGSPANGKNVLSVGASHNFMSKEKAVRLGVKSNRSHYTGDVLQATAFSSLGPTLDMRIKPEVVAPGSPILSLYSDPWPKRPQFKRRVLWGNLDHHYSFAGGTSMSTPIVSGTVALVRQAIRLNYGGRLEANSALIKGILVNSAQRFDLPLPKDQSVEERIGLKSLYAQGYGLVSIPDALGLSGTRSYMFRTGKISNGEIKRIDFELPQNAKDVRVTLSWIDPPNEKNETEIPIRQLVNDLDLVVESNKTRYFPLSAISVSQYREMYFRFNTFKSKTTSSWFPFVRSKTVSNVDQMLELQAKLSQGKSLYPYSIKDFTNNLEQVDIGAEQNISRITAMIYGSELARKQAFNLIVSFKE